MLRRWLPLTLLMFTACPVTTDLGTPCFLVRKDPDGGPGIHIKESEIQANRDFISFGAPECEDLVCVRDSAYVCQGDCAPTSDAKGYCSRPCVPSSSVGCPAHNSADDNDVKLRLTCRALLLDSDTLGKICTDDPAKCQLYFGDTKSPYFCARGTGSADAGP